MKSTQLSKGEVATILEKFVEGSGGQWDWDDFITAMRFDDPVLESIRLRCGSLDNEFPPVVKGHYTNQEGMKVIREYIAKLRKEG